MSKHADEHVQRWYASGHLYKCPNPPHAFTFWRVALRFAFTEATK